MERALELARKGMGKVSPNPMVGCVIVKNNKIIGEGWHKEFGGPHAEVNAVNSVNDKDLIEGSDVYVNLEPCAHYGKTPPCADLLSTCKVGHVIIANKDTNPLVGGKGIEILRRSGAEITKDVLSEEGRELNKRFFIFHEKKRPYIILKWAETADGYIARENFDARWISNEYSRQLVHKWRSEEDAIMVGSGTVRYDDPRLNVRDWDGKDPVRIIIDPELEITEKAKIYDNSQNTLVYNTRKGSSDGNIQMVKIEEKNFLENIFKDMFRRSIQSVIVEGGSMLLHSIIQAHLWDEARVFKAPISFGKGVTAPQMIGGNLIERISIFEDDLFLFRRQTS